MAVRRAMPRMIGLVRVRSAESPEVADLRAQLAEAVRDRDGYRATYLQREAEAGQARADADGYRAAYLQHMAELGSAVAERDGYKSTLDQAATELSRFRTFLRDAPVPPTRPRQVVFLHIQKTGGISLLDFFGRQFEWSRILWVHSPAEFDVYHPDEVRHFDFVCGHFTARNLAAVRLGALLCTFLREPADRVLSCYWYFRGYQGQMRESIRHAVESARSKSLLDFLRDQTPEVRRHVADHQAHALAGDWFAPDDRPAGDLLAAALLGLERFGCVGLTEDLDAGLGRVCRLAGWVPPPAVGRLNATPTRQRVEDLSPAERDAIRELTAVDAEVYRAAEGRSRVAT